MYMTTLYFSATGNSKYIAELFFRQMNAVCYSMELLTRFELVTSSLPMQCPTYHSVPGKPVFTGFLKFKTLIFKV